MLLRHHESMPMVSVIIPCYNQSCYLPVAIRSVMDQDYPCKEIVVINDGSTDDTENIAKSFDGIIYVYQRNKGASAAKNSGIVHSRGDYLVFLDADDVLLPDALSQQVKIMEHHKDLAFVAGGHVISDENLTHLREVHSEIDGDYYLNLLERNFIGMHAAVMYRKCLMQQFMFDASLKACEDYDVYLRIASKHPVLNHRAPIAVYRNHGTNMSNNLSMMLDQALFVLNRQRTVLQTNEEISAYETGIRNWINFYSYHSYGKLKHVKRSDRRYKKDFLRLLWTYKRRLYIRHYLRKLYLLSRS